MANATTKSSTRKSAAAKTEAVETPKAPRVFNALPKRSYTLSKPAAHSDFFDLVRKENEGRTGDERVWLEFPRPSKGVAAAIKRGVYAAIEAGEFTAANRKVEGEDLVLVTVADKAETTEEA